MRKEQQSQTKADSSGADNFGAKGNPALSVSNPLNMRGLLNQDKENEAAPLYFPSSKNGSMREHASVRCVLQSMDCRRGYRCCSVTGAASCAAAVASATPRLTHLDIHLTYPSRRPAVLRCSASTRLTTSVRN